MANQDKISFPDMDEDPMKNEADPNKGDEQELEDGVQDGDGGEQEVSPAITEALHRGWQEKDDWVAAGKNPDEWVDATTFNERGKLMDVISKQSKKLKSMEKAVDQFKQYHADVQKKAIETAKKQLLEEKAEALDMNDTRRAVEIDEEIKKVDKEAEAAEAEANGDNGFKAYFQDEWIGSNSWYNEKRGMKVVADQLGAEYYQAHPNSSPEEVFEYVDKEIRKEFPDHFTRRRGNSPVEGTRRSGKSSKTSNKVKNRLNELSDDERKIGNNFVAAGLFDNLEEYVQDLVKNGL